MCAFSISNPPRSEAHSVVGEVAESEGVSAQGFQAAVDGVGGAVGGVAVEVGRHIVAAPVQGAAS
jgi:hypothetical protein